MINKLKKLKYEFDKFMYFTLNSPVINKDYQDKKRAELMDKLKKAKSLHEIEYINYYLELIK